MLLSVNICISDQSEDELYLTLKDILYFHVHPEEVHEILCPVFDKPECRDEKPLSSGYGDRPGTDKPGPERPGTDRPGPDRPGDKDEDKDEDEDEYKDKRFDFHRITNVLSDMFGTMVGGGKPEMEKIRIIYQYLAEIYDEKEDVDCDVNEDDIFTSSSTSTRSSRTTDISRPIVPSTVERTVPSTINFLPPAAPSKIRLTGENTNRVKKGVPLICKDIIL